VVVVEAVDDDVCGTVDDVVDDVCGTVDVEVDDEVSGTVDVEVDDVDDEVSGTVDVEVDDVDDEVSGTVDVDDVDEDVCGTVVEVVELVVEEVEAVVDEVEEVDDEVGAVVDEDDEDDEDEEEEDDDEEDELELDELDELEDELDEIDELLDEPPATTGMVASVSVGTTHVTAVWIVPFNVTPVVSWNALTVIAPDAGAVTSTLIVGVVNVPAANGPGVPVENLSVVAPIAAVSVMLTGVDGGAVGTIVAVPGFTIEPALNAALCSWYVNDRPEYDVIVKPFEELGSNAEPPGNVIVNVAPGAT
jgi:hypothetical protein